MTSVSGEVSCPENEEFMILQVKEDQTQHKFEFIHLVLCTTAITTKDQPKTLGYLHAQSAVPHIHKTIIRQKKQKQTESSLCVFPGLSNTPSHPQPIQDTTIFPTRYLRHAPFLLIFRWKRRANPGVAAQTTVPLRRLTIKLAELEGKMNSRIHLFGGRRPWYSSGNLMS